MNKVRLVSFTMALAGLLMFNACKKQEIDVKQTEFSVQVVNPVGVEGVKIKDAVITFKEINSGSKTTSDKLANNTLNLTLAEGSYDVSVEGNIEYTEAGQTLTGKVRGIKQGVVVNAASPSTSVTLSMYNGADGFVLKEIYFTGSVTPQGKQYNGDKYFIIYNNSDKTLYADGLIIAQSGFLTTTKRAYTPDIMGEAFTASEVVKIPGTGTTYPILPGKSFTVANNAINHLEYNANSIDLRNAEFELELLPAINVDNPQVTNLINLSGFMTMHNRGFKSFVLAKGNIDPVTYDYTYINTIGNVTKVTDYKIPNSTILDAVNLSVEAKFEWIVTDPGLDIGWTYCGKVDSDANRYGKSVRRKIQSTTADGRVILKDTNNSTVDFDAEVTPSLQK